MADQSTGATGTVENTDAALARDSSHMEHNPGRPISWVGTSIVVIGFIIGGIAMVPAPHWTIFWIGTAVAIVGSLVLVFSKAMSTDWY